jgi:hypothetical protein
LVFEARDKLPRVADCLGPDGEACGSVRGELWIFARHRLCKVRLVAGACDVRD